MLAYCDWPFTLWTYISIIVGAFVIICIRPKTYSTWILGIFIAYCSDKTINWEPNASQTPF